MSSNEAFATFIRPHAYHALTLSTSSIRCFLISALPWLVSKSFNLEVDPLIGSIKKKKRLHFRNFPLMLASSLFSHLQRGLTGRQDLRPENELDT